MSVVVKVSPVISLLGVEPNEVVRKYKEGHFRDLRLPKVHGQVKIDTGSVVRRVHSTDPESETFGFHSKSGLESVFVTTDHENFRCVHNGGHRKVGGRCRTCGKTYDDRVMMGIPVRVTLEYRQGLAVPVFWCKGSYCSYECALHRILDLGLGVTRRNVMYESPEANLRMMYQLTYGDQDGRLEPCNDPDLLVENGGPIPYNEWVGHTHQYVEVGNLITYPAKSVYQLAN